jgi:polyhydroxyalkanoate synthase
MSIPSAWWLDSFAPAQRLADAAASSFAEGFALAESRGTMGEPARDLVTAERACHENSDKQKADSAAIRDRCIETAKGNNRLLRQALELWSGWLHGYLTSAPGTPTAYEGHARFLLDQMEAALAPENFFWANAGAVKRFFDTNGESLTTGYANWLKDTQTTLVPTVDQGSFEVGRNLAVTPGAVVYRTPLFELIQYTPTTSTVHEIPVVFVPPWINKYYVLDLSPTNSMIGWLRDQGFLVFTVSWKNPEPAMRGLEFADYALAGALEAIEKARAIVKGKAVHAVGFCIGGTALATLMAWLSRLDDAASHGPMESPVAHWTLLASLVDFSETGQLGLLTGPEVLPLAEALMEPQGILDGSLMELVFRSLRSDSLIWRPAIRRYLYGDPPARSDLLFWNSDTTRLTQRMLLFYLQEFYIRNRLVSEEGLMLQGRRLRLNRISQPLYLVGCIEDHIVPWKQALRIRDFIPGPIRVALSSEGHVAGIVNPPSAKSYRRHWASDFGPAMDPQVWLEEQEARPGSWWTDWGDWLRQRCGPKVPAPGLGSPAYPPICPAPGYYVME